jgi:GT2 family glycosyltransferase
VSYRSGDRAVRSCRSALESGAEVVLVENASGRLGAIEEAPPGVVLVKAPKNLGFGTGSNLAALGASAEHLLFLNPDAELLEGALDALLEVMDERPEVGIAGPALRFPDGRPQGSVRRDPTAAAVLHQYTAWKFLMVFRRAYRRYRSPDEGGETEVLMGSALLVRRALFEELSGFDPRYFMYYEEADLCRRARERGAGVALVPGATAVHEGGASAGLEVARLAAVRLVSAQRYLKRFLPRWRYLAFRLAFLSGFPIRAMYDLVRDLLYALLYAIWPAKRAKAGRKLREALGAIRLLTVDLFRVAAG